ncbi:MAG: UDP-glucose/GDP-mannose dehydrogenase family protein [Spirochaetes bacterium]|nr:UDP-glucose/GDP-mannose dehydrogenase family protein [Spirochaetota bacterium]
MKLNIGVFGLGYVGLITAVGFSYIGFDVNCFDINKEKLKALRDGKIPFYEENIEEILKDSIKQNKINFLDDSKDVIEKSDIIFIAVGTPPDKEGKADLKYIYEVVLEVIKYINSYKIIVIKSTVPPGTCKRVELFIKDNIKNISEEKKIDVDVVSNPEFLREGRAFHDFINPDRIIIGTNSEKAKEMMCLLYDYFIKRNFKIVLTDRESSELIKYASNCFLATKISYINELSILAEKIGANIKDVSLGMGLDLRIGNSFLDAGPGYGGSCLPKDTKALFNFARENGINLKILESTILANENQIKFTVNKILKNMNGVVNKIISVLGLTFKPNTDDIRESVSIKIINLLLQNGAFIKTYCPKGIEKTKELFKDENNIIFCENVYETFKESEAIIIATDWEEFNNLDYNFVYFLMKDYFLFDLRNMFYNNHKIKQMFYYYGTGIICSKAKDLIF